MKSVSDFVEAVKRVAGKGLRAAVITHRNADPDAVGAALAVRRLISSLGFKTCLYSPEGLSSLSRDILASSGVSWAPECHAGEGYYLAVAVDSANKSQLGRALDMYESASVRAVIDHHASGSIHESADIRLVEPSAGSSTELSVMACIVAGVELSPGESTAALAGIVFDTGRFLRASRWSFEAAAALTSWGGDYAAVIEFGRSRGRRERVEFSLRYAKLKAFSRLRVGRVCGEIIVAATRIGSFESHVARSLIDEGADVGIAVAERAEEYRVSIRVSRLAIENGITARNVAEIIAEKLGGEGGGHEEAGMAHVPYKAAPGSEALLERLYKAVHGRLGRICSGRDG